MAEAIVCVLGLSRATGDVYTSGEGVGKSCLCYRFLHGGFDNYVSEHPSLLAMHEFESRAVNGVHFIYWGVSKQMWSDRSRKGEKTVNVHVVENTVLYEDVTSKPFSSYTKPDDLAVYMKTSLGRLESPGKVSYLTRDAIGLPEMYRPQQYPLNIADMPRGYIVVADVSVGGSLFDSQMQRATMLCKTLKKKNKKFIIAATKTEKSDPTSLESVQKIKSKFRTEVVYTSSEYNYNVSVAFRTIIHNVLPRKTSREDVPSFEEAAGLRLAQQTSAKQSFRQFVIKWTTSFHDDISHIEKTEQYKHCQLQVGQYATKKVFADVLLKKRMREVLQDEEVADKQEMIEKYIDSHQDLWAYSKYLKMKMQAEFDGMPSLCDSPQKLSSTASSPSHRTSDAVLKSESGCKSTGGHLRFDERQMMIVEDQNTSQPSPPHTPPTPPQPSPSHTPSQPSPSHTPSQLSPSPTAPQPSLSLTPPLTPSQPSPSHIPPQPSPSHTPSQLSPSHTASQPSPSHTPSQLSPSHTPSHPSPSHTPPQPSPSSTPPQPIPSLTPSQLSPSLTPSQSSSLPTQPSPSPAPPQQSPSLTPPQPIPSLIPPQPSPSPTPPQLSCSTRQKRKQTYLDVASKPLPEPPILINFL